MSAGQQLSNCLNGFVAGRRVEESGQGDPHAGPLIDNSLLRLLHCRTRRHTLRCFGELPHEVRKQLDERFRELLPEEHKNFLTRSRAQSGHQPQV